MLIFGTLATELLKRWKMGKVSKGFEPKRHKVKEGIPTMGGLLIVFASVTATIMWADPKNVYVWIALFIYIGFAAIGLYDDYKKTVLHNPMGMRGKFKFISQSTVAVIGILLLILLAPHEHQSRLLLPFFKNYFLNLSWVYIIFAWFVIVGTSNAVNLTDGLDGLAIMPAIICFSAFAILSYVAGNTIYAEYLSVFYVKSAGELTIFCGAMAGAGLGFLWFNAYPATIIMGDVGSLSIGASLAAVAVMVKQEILLVFIGGLFVIETVSVILQVGYFRLTKGKRLFLMAPIHHHFELKGWSEPKIIVRFWIISFILTIVAMSTLKLR
jgi:phospho-N-acetylmuramoyl-pentapeptide-transferase